MKAPIDKKNTVAPLPENHFPRNLGKCPSRQAKNSPDSPGFHRCLNSLVPSLYQETESQYKQAKKRMGKTELAKEFEGICS